MLQRSHAVTLSHSTWMSTAALHRSCHHCTCLLEYAEVTSIKCTAADDWLTLPRSGRHDTVEVELQSTAMTIKCCQASPGGQQASLHGNRHNINKQNYVVGLSSHQCILIFMIETLKTIRITINIRILNTDS